MEVHNNLGAGFGNRLQDALDRIQCRIPYEKYDIN